MTIKSSGSSLAFSEIEAEFGANGSRSLGAYRVSQNVGELSLPLDSSIPTSGQIKFSDFYSKSLNVVVDMHSGSTEFRKSARSDKWNNNQVTVVGGFRSKKESGSKIIIHINKKFGSDKSNVNNCAVKTGSWSAASVQVDVGGEGDVLGALGTTSSLVSSSYQSNSGILTLKNPTGSTDSQKLASFQDAINNTFYTTVNDNPTSLNVDLVNPVDDKRIVEIKTFEILKE